MSTEREIETHEIEICPECVVFIANGDTPEPLPHADGTPRHWSDGEADDPATRYPDGWHPKDIDRNWPPSEGWQIDPCPSDRTADPSFSVSSCDACGCALGGDRYPATAYRFPDEIAEQN